jgi:hypothetical protein
MFWGMEKHIWTSQLANWRQVMLKTTSAQIVPSSLHCLVDDHVSTKQKIPKCAKTQTWSQQVVAHSWFKSSRNVNLRPVPVDQWPPVFRGSKRFYHCHVYTLSLCEYIRHICFTYIIYSYKFYKLYKYSFLYKHTVDIRTSRSPMQISQGAPGLLDSWVTAAETRPPPS